MSGSCVAFALPPVVERELRVASRRARTYWGRVSAAAVAVIIGIWSIAGLGALTMTPAAGRDAFRVLSLVAAFMLANSVIRLTAEAFAREKREDTLGLLFLTPLKPRDIVFGKLASSTLGGFYRFIAVVPVLALPMLGGGVTFGDFARLVLVLSNLAFFAGAFGLYVSANSWDEKRAASVATGVFVGLAMFVPLAIGAGVPATPFAASFIFAVSPAYAVWLAALAGSVQPPAFWWSLLLIHVGGWLLLRATCRLLPRCWQEKPVTGMLDHPLTGQPAVPVRVETFVPERLGPRPIRTQKTVQRQIDAGQRADLLEDNPIVWFALRWKARPTGIWLLCVVAFVGFVMISTSANLRFFDSPMFALFVCYLVNVAVKFQVADQVGLALARDRAEDSLQLLLSTPITPTELVQGHLIAARKGMRSMIEALFVIETVWLALPMALSAANSTTQSFAIHLAIGGAVVVFLMADISAIEQVALWESAVQKDSRAAAANAKIKILILPWVMVFMLVPMLAGLFGWPAQAIPWFALAVVAGAGALANWWFSRKARQRLQRDLVDLARFRAAGGVEFYPNWRRLGRWLGQFWRISFGTGRSKKEVNL